MTNKHFNSYKRFLLSTNVMICHTIQMQLRSQWTIEIRWSLTGTK